jgi:hypothetical protein
MDKFQHSQNDFWVEVAAWIATAVAVVVAVIITRGALPLFAFIIPLCVPTIRKKKGE